jgi:hypothetical protein
LDSDLEDSSTQSFDALLTSQTGSFWDGVRALEVQSAQRANYVLDVKLLQLLNGNPHRSLTKFTTEAEIESHTLGVLIRAQPKLKELSGPIYNLAGLQGPPGKAHVNGKLQE